MTQEKKDYVHGCLNFSINALTGNLKETDAMSKALLPDVSAEIDTLFGEEFGSGEVHYCLMRVLKRKFGMKVEDNFEKLSL